ncbi:MAG: radical SAM protein [Candidatus Ranarchaeia archaeon]|jgi:pyruvate formate-lyase activating enzyme-like uncharacterized protein
MSLSSVDRTPFGGLIVGELPLGCKLCLEGAKLVVFVTGLCKSTCFYCPVSSERIYQDVTFGNERPIGDLRSLIDEAKVSSALGASITGGDPLESFSRTIDAVNLLKSHFSSTFHIHLYTSGRGMTTKHLQELEDAGLDELRFHIRTKRSFSLVEKAMKFSFKVGAEVPAIPQKETFLKTTAVFLDDIQADLFNLNELEFSESNQERMQNHKYMLVEGALSATQGSRETAERLIEWIAQNTSLNAYYCPTIVKDSVQLTNRFRRRAEGVAEPYAQITEEGLIVKGLILGSSEELEVFKKTLIKDYETPPDQLKINHKKGWIETHPEFVKDLLRERWDGQLAIMEEHPTFFRPMISYTPLNFKE